MQETPVDIFLSERDNARRTGKCMACDRPTRAFGHRFAAICTDHECFRYWEMLWRASRKQQRKSQSNTELLCKDCNQPIKRFAHGGFALCKTWRCNLALRVKRRYPTRKTAPKVGKVADNGGSNV